MKGSDCHSSHPTVFSGRELLIIVERGLGNKPISTGKGTLKRRPYFVRRRNPNLLIGLNSVLASLCVCVSVCLLLQTLRLLPQLPHQWRPLTGKP